MFKKVLDHPGKYPLWWVDDGKLMKRARHPYPELVEADESWLVVVPREQRNSIIMEHHDPPTCGHLGIFKTVARISQRYYWPSMRSDVARYIRRCRICLQTKPLQKAPAGQMLSIQPTSSRPFQIVSVDLVGPLPRSASGNAYILSVVDVFSKFAMFFPLRSATTQHIVRWLENYVILVFGAETVIADNGSQFRSKVFLQTMSQYGIKVRYLANYHPQANPVERVHRVLKTILTSYVSEDHRQWDKLVAKAGFAIRSARHEVTSLPPNFVVFGRNVRLPRDSGPNSDGSTPFDPVSRSEALNKVFVDVQKKLQQAYERSRHTYNLRRRDERFQLNQKVWKKNYFLSDAAKHFTAKLANKFSGPYAISRILSPWTYELSDPNGRSLGVWHAKDLKAHPQEDSP